MVERAVGAEESVEYFFVGHRVAYDVLDGAMPEGPRLVTDNGPATVAQPRSVGEARLVVHSYTIMILARVPQKSHRLLVSRLVFTHVD